jgi:hypothetical protein
LDKLSEELHIGHNKLIDGIEKYGAKQTPKPHIREAGATTMRNEIKYMESNIIPLINTTKEASESALENPNIDEFSKKRIKKFEDMMTYHATEALKTGRYATIPHSGSYDRLKLENSTSYNGLFDNILKAKDAALKLKEDWTWVLSKISSKNSNSNGSSGGRRKHTRRSRTHRKRTHRKRTHRRRTHRK